MAARRPSHAGSWYSSNGVELSQQLTKWLSEAQVTCGAARAVIAPHAGYSYSGPTAAYAYKGIQTKGIKRVFLLGPSHNVYSPKCLLSTCDAYATPIGSLPIDSAIYDELSKSSLFDEMSLAVDEREHSLEMHMPYLVHLFGGTDATLVPIMVGALSEQTEALVGRLLAPYLADPQNLFVISSDFCHWGERFNFTYHDSKHGGEIFQSIEELDKQGMALIEAQDAAGFAAYQRKFGNTICGRHPIAVLLHALNALPSLSSLPTPPAPYELRFVRYAQSSRVRGLSDSSVSYASAIVWHVDRLGCVPDTG
jgi:AmmeMemoRadiSam system protein B